MHHRAVIQKAPTCRPRLGPFKDLNPPFSTGQGGANPTKVRSRADACRAHFLGSILKSDEKRVRRNAIACVGSRRERLTNIRVKGLIDSSVRTEKGKDVDIEFYCINILPCSFLLTHLVICENSTIAGSLPAIASIEDRKRLLVKSSLSDLRRMGWPLGAKP